MADDFVICTIELKTIGSEPIDIAKGIIEYERVRNMHSDKDKLRDIESIANHLKEYVRHENKPPIIF